MRIEVVSFESLSGSLELELNTSAIIKLDFVYTNEKSIIVKKKKPFDWINVPFLGFYARNFAPKIARFTPVLGYKPNGRG